MSSFVLTYCSLPKVSRPWMRTGFLKSSVKAMLFVYDIGSIFMLGWQNWAVKPIRRRFSVDFDPWTSMPKIKVCSLPIMIIVIYIYHHEKNIVQARAQIGRCYSSIRRRWSYPGSRSRCFPPCRISRDQKIRTCGSQKWIASPRCPHPPIFMKKWHLWFHKFFIYRYMEQWYWYLIYCQPHTGNLDSLVLS